MGERFGGENYFSKAEKRDPNVQLLEKVNELNRLLAQLVEQGGELSAQTKSAMRQQIQNILSSLGLTDLRQLAEVKAHLHTVLATVPIPKDYPTKNRFVDQLQKVIDTGVVKNLPPIWRSIQASDVARLGQADWRKVKGRGMSTLEYIYGLGAVMSSEIHYIYIINPNDAIRVKPDWLLDNGLHRGLALKALGEIYVEMSGMNSWVKPSITR